MACYETKHKDTFFYFAIVTIFNQTKTVQLQIFKHGYIEKKKNE